MASSKPVFSTKVGTIQLAVFENEIKGKEGAVARSISITRSYKLGDEWKTTTSFRGSDLPHVKLAIDKAMEFLYCKDVPF